MFLDERGEGQRLVPGMCQEDRWNPGKAIDWSSVKASWFARISLIEKLVGAIDVVIEKSPPNLVRADQLTATFPNNKLVAFNRNPYANCASTLYRRHDPEAKSESERIELVRDLASRWLFRSTWLRKWVEAFGALFFSYEQFCSSPDVQVQKIIDLLPALRGIDVERPIKVKDYPVQGIEDQNERQISQLCERERRAIREELSAHKDLLAFFNYTSEWQAHLEQAREPKVGGQSS